MDCFILSNERMNKNKEAAIIEGPEAVLNSKDVNNPIITDNKPPITEKRIICCGLFEIFLAIAAGMISICLLYTSPSPRDRG